MCIQGDLVSDASDLDHFVYSSSHHRHLPFPHPLTTSRPEINLHNWTATHASIFRNTASIPWEVRIPRAFWKGAVWVAPGIRQPIVDCDDDPLHRWRVESSDTAWGTEKDKNSTKLENQCDHRWALCTLVSTRVSYSPNAPCFTLKLLSKPRGAHGAKDLFGVK